MNIITYIDEQAILFENYYGKKPTVVKMSYYNRDKLRALLINPAVVAVVIKKNRLLYNGLEVIATDTSSNLIIVA